MIKAILGTVKAIFQPAADLVDELHTSDEERLTLKARLSEIEAAVSEKFVEYASLIAQLQADIIKTEANSGSWLARNWRPVAMLNFLLIVNMYWFGFQPENLSEETINHIFEIIKWGLGGYVVGRSVEKTATTVGKILEKKDG